MFGGDPFGNPFQHMQRQMQEMDNLMNSMMGDSFGMFGNMFGGRHSQQPMIGNGPQRANDMMMSPFGGGLGGGLFGGLMQQMNNMQHHALNDPNSTVFSQSTMISYDGSGQPRIVQSSTRKAGDVMETRQSHQHGDEARMRVGHHIGDREHVIEKKRDKNGRVRQRQQFVNLDEENAEDFNNEFKARASRHMTGFTGRPQQQAIQNGSSSSSKDKRRLENGRCDTSGSAPIITVPDDDEDDDDHNVNRGRRSRGMKRYDDEDDDVEYISSSHSSGPMIREITEDVEDTHGEANAKRRKGLFGKLLSSD